MDGIRDNFPILKRKINGHQLVYMDNGATTQKPQEVIDSLVDFYSNHNANIHRGVHTLSVEATEMVDQVREKVADFLSAETQEIVFVKSATEGLNLVANSVGQKIAHGENIVISAMEHHANLVPWQMVCKKTGAEFRVIRVDEEGKLKVERVGEVIKEKGVTYGELVDLIDSKTVVVCLTMISNVTGVEIPIIEVVKKIRNKNKKCLIVLDASQAVAHKKINIKKLGADVICFSSHKMYGPTGVGVMWINKNRMDEVTPLLFGGDMIREVKFEETTFAEGFQQLEAGTPPIAEIVGLGAAIDFLNKIDMSEIERYESELTEKLVNGFLDLEKEGIVTIYGPRCVENRSGILSFNVTGAHAHDVASYLDHYGIAVRSGQHCAAPLLTQLSTLATVRASLAIYNTVEEIEYLVKIVRDAYKYFLR